MPLSARCAPLLCAVLLAGPASARELVLTHGEKDPEQRRTAELLVDAVRERGRTVGLKASGAATPLQSLEQLAKGDAQLALLRSDLAFSAHAGEGAFPTAQPLQALAVLQPVVIHVVVRAGISRVAELGGKRVALSPAGGLDAPAEWLPFEVEGLSAHALQLTRLAPSAGRDAFIAGKVDAWVTLAPPGSPDVKAALAAGGALATVTPERVAPLLRSRPYLHSGTLDPAAYQTAGPLFVLELDQLLVSGDKVTAAEAQELLEVAYGAQGKLEGLTPDRTSQRGCLPLQPGALAYLDNAKALPYPIKVFVGAYAYSISELDITSGTYLFDGYLWFRWRGPHLAAKPFEFSVINGTVENLEDSPVIQADGWNRQSRRITVKLRANFLLHDYPFDTQKLPFELEHRWMGAEKLIFVPDDGAASGGSLMSSFLSRDVQINDWVIKDVEHLSTIKKYETDFGSIEKGVWDGKSSRYALILTIRRTIIPYVVKFIIPLVVIVLMNFAVFFIRSDEFEVQAGIVITALLSCIAFHISQSGSLPEVGYLVKADKFFLLSYVVIFLTLVQIVVENALHHRGKQALTALIDKICRVVIPGFFFITLTYLLFEGM